MPKMKFSNSNVNLMKNFSKFWKIVSPGANSKCIQRNNPNITPRIVAANNCR